MGLSALKAPRRGHGFNPRWHELFTFQLMHPSVAQLVFEVLDVTRNGRQIIAAASFPLAGVREGIRWVALKDSKHHEIDQCGLLLEARVRGPWALLRRRQQRQRFKNSSKSNSSKPRSSMGVISSVSFDAGYNTRDEENDSQQSW